MGMGCILSERTLTLKQEIEGGAIVTGGLFFVETHKRALRLFSSKMCCLAFIPLCDSRQRGE
jgi:hypothetical protein